jgi:glutaconyl-CoA decarboxylase
LSRKVTVIVEGREYTVEVGDLEERPIKATVNHKTYQVQVPSQSAQTTTPAPPDTPIKSVKAPAPEKIVIAPSTPGVSGSTITSPMPGDILEIKVKPGDIVNPGDIVCVLEAMKMKNMIRTPHTGVIASIEVAVGQAVDYGVVLVTFE